MAFPLDTRFPKRIAEKSFQGDVRAFFPKVLYPRLYLTEQSMEQSMHINMHIVNEILKSTEILEIPVTFFR